MSLSDKMALWAKKDGARSGPEEGPMFEGVSDYEEDRADEVVILKYRNLVTESPPYHWLLSTLRKEMAQRANDSETEMRDGIKESILGVLHSGVISKRRPPLVYEVTFQLPWDRVTLLEGMDKSASSDDVLGSILTFTSNSAWFHANSADEYLRRTWPSTGKHLVHLMQELGYSGGLLVFGKRVRFLCILLSLHN
jgi:hypothetical protein